MSRSIHELLADRVPCPVCPGDGRVDTKPDPKTGEVRKTRCTTCEGVGSMRRYSAAYLRSLKPKEQERALRAMKRTEQEALKYDWTFWARDNQLEPDGDWWIWNLIAGRRFGKTRASSGVINQWARTARFAQILIAGRTASEVRSILIEGPSGILRTSPPWFMPKYEPSKMRITWPNGVIGITRYGEEPDSFRGFEGGGAVLDELYHWKGGGRQAWETLVFGLSEKGAGSVKIVITSTPKPTSLCKEIIRMPGSVLVQGSTFDNAANLGSKFIREISRFDGTRFGRQELYGEVLDDNPAALWTYDTIANFRISTVTVVLRRIVVAVDPAGTYGENSDETGIIVAGLGEDGHGYLLADYSCREHPYVWAQRVEEACRLWGADSIVAEKNYGGYMVETTLRSAHGDVPRKIDLVDSKRGKQIRGEPIAALYQKGLIHHVGVFPELENQQTSVDLSDTKSKDHDDRIDATVMAFSALMLDGHQDFGSWFMAMAGSAA